MTWQLQDAKQRFSRLVEQAVEEGPQVVTRRGEEVVVVLSIDEYRRLVGQALDFKAFLRKAPDLEALKLHRSEDTGRDAEL